MANNRLLLRCVRCATDIPIARLQVGMGSTWLPSRTPPVEYTAWLATHSHCGDPEEAGLRVTLASENADSLILPVQTVITHVDQP
jgi:hypothetical protein